MSYEHWTLDDIDWAAFEPAKVDPEILKIIKAASMVEYNGADYATYLCNVFPDDSEFQEAVNRWADEEIQHGAVLARWAELADPVFDFKASFKRFADGYSLPLDASTSVRGTRSGELVARCIVEVGTSSYYSALADASEEPVLIRICKLIAADELRHYKLFYSFLKRYLKTEKIGRLRRVLIAFGRISETEDDELAYAYFAANGEAYDRKLWSKAYLQRASQYYRPKHLDLGVAMTFKAAGLNPQSRLAGWASRAGYWAIRQKAKGLKQAA
jgi:rubrerythrin